MVDGVVVKFLGRRKGGNAGVLVGGLGWKSGQDWIGRIPYQGIVLEECLGGDKVL